MSAAKYVTWKGEDDAHYMMEVGEDGKTEKVPTPGPSFNLWGSGNVKVRFDKDKPKLIDPAQAVSHEERALFEHILKKAPNMGVFEVTDVEKPKAFSRVVETPTAFNSDDSEPDEIDEPAHAEAKHHAKAKPKKR
jgi:hypothetical protein